MTGSVEYASSSQRPSVYGDTWKMGITFFNNMTSKSVWALTGVELFEIASLSLVEDEQSKIQLNDFSFTRESEWP